MFAMPVPLIVLNPPEFGEPDFSKPESRGGGRTHQWRLAAVDPIDPSVGYLASRESTSATTESIGTDT
jgi:hypothetical protein